MGFKYLSERKRKIDGLPYFKILSLIKNAGFKIEELEPEYLFLVFRKESQKYHHLFNIFVHVYLDHISIQYQFYRAFTVENILNEGSEEV